MTLIYKVGAIEIWAVTEAWSTDYYVGVTASGDSRVCASSGLAREIAAR